MWNKIKKGLSDTKDKAGRNIQYAKGKSSGFEHPEQVEETVQVLRWNRDQIPKLLSRISSLCEHQKDLTSSENKAYKEFSVVGGHEKENPQLEMYFKAYADLQYALSEQRGLMHAQMDEVKADMKHFDSKSLTDIKVIHDKTNRALTDARYWRTHANPTKLQEAESRYKQLSFELVDMVNSLVQNKETVYPEYMRKLGQAQLEFFERAVEAARLYMQKLYEIGPVPVTVGTPLSLDFDLGSSELISETTTTTTSSVVPPPSNNPVVPPPRYNTEVFVALYDYSATNADELSFKTGEHLNIISKEGSGWWKAELRGQVGFVPSNYLNPMQ